MASLSLGTQASGFKACKTPKDVMDLIHKEGVELVDACFTDPFGLWHHCTFHVDQLDDMAWNEGFPFDGSSIRLFRHIQESDMLMRPDPRTAFIDPFFTAKTLHLTCTIREPNAPEGYTRDPRSTAERAIKYLQSTGIADQAFFGPEPEFFIFNSVRYKNTTNTSFFEVDSTEGWWNTDKHDSGPNLGHRVAPKSWYFPTAPIDSEYNLRGEMLLTMGRCGVPVEKHHHEVAQAQGELGFRALALVECADALQVYKYVIKNVARQHNRTATFMPKPIIGDNGSGMHVHSSLWKDGKPLFFDENGPYVKLSQLCMWYIGGILKHAPALLAITSPTLNSYKRLVPGYEAPVNLAYSQGNRSASIRIPMYQPDVPKAKRIEFRCPDPACNPYLAFSALLMAGLDGIQNKIDPGKPLDVDIYELSPEEAAKIPKTPGSLAEAINALEADHQWLTKGGVFTEDFIRAYIAARRAEIKRSEVTPSPLEYELYFHC